MTSIIVENVIMIIAWGLIPAAYFSCYLFGIYLRRYLSLRKPRYQKWAVMAMAVICLCAFGIMIHNHTWQTKAIAGIAEIDIYAGERYDSDIVGTLHFTQSYKPKQVTAVGYMEIKGQYHKIKVADGKVMAPGVPEKYCKDAAAGLKADGILSDDFCGVSIPYDKLKSRDDAYYFPISLKGWLIRIALVFGPLMAVFIDIFIEQIKRKRRNRLLKTRLQDL